MKNGNFDPSISARNPVSNHIFNSKWYKEYYKFNFLDNEDALLHFHQFGFESGLDPSPLVNTLFCRSIGTSYGWTIQNATSLFLTLSSVVAGSNIGWSPRFIPNWISAQIGLTEEEANRTLFTHILDVVEEGILKISPHPGILRREASQKGRILSEVLTDFIQDEHIISYATSNIKKYIAHNIELKNFTSDGEAFDHMWSVGLRKNHLKYLGFKAPRWMNHDTLIRHIITMDLVPKFQAKIFDENQLLTKLPLTSFKIDESSAENFVFLASYNEQKITNPPKYHDLLKVLDITDGQTTKIIKSIECNAVSPYPLNVIHKSDILDTDLLSIKNRPEVEFIVYSVNLGMYDFSPTPPYMENCQYYLITDAAKVNSNLPWQIVRPTIAERDLKRLCLWYKTHPHLLFPETKNSLWIDSNICCLPGSEKLIHAQQALAEVATFVHPDRNCVYKEAQAIVESGLDRSDVISTVVDQMRTNDMPEEHGLFETNVLYSKSQDYAVVRFMNKWWSNVFFGSRRDQMSFTYTAYQTGIEISPLEGQNSVKNSRYFTKQPHRYSGGRIIETI